MTGTTAVWKTFYFESNLFFDHVKGPEDWKRLRKAYPHMTDEKLLSTKEATYGGRRSEELRQENPQYGFGHEHDGVKTLHDFFVENNMLELLPASEGPKVPSQMELAMVESIRLLVLSHQARYKEAANQDDERGYSDSAKENRSQFWALDRVREGIDELISKASS